MWGVKAKSLQNANSQSSQKFYSSTVLMYLYMAVDKCYCWGFKVSKTRQPASKERKCRQCLFMKSSASQSVFKFCWVFFYFICLICCVHMVCKAVMMIPGFCPWFRCFFLGLNSLLIFLYLGLCLMFGKFSNSSFDVFNLLV